MLTTYKGVVTSGIDDQGVFGEPGGDLTGSSYTLVFTLDTSLRNAFVYSSYGPQLFYGGFQFNAPAIQSATIFIKGGSYSVSGNRYSSTGFLNLPGGPDQIVHTSGGFYASNNELLYERIDNSIINKTGDLLNNSDYSVAYYHELSEGEEWYGYAGASINSLVDYSDRQIFSAILKPLSVEVRQSAAVVPEPATWALLILGFGAVGGAMRRRTRPIVTIA